MSLTGDYKDKTNTSTEITDDKTRAKPQDKSKAKPCDMMPSHNDRRLRDEYVELSLDVLRLTVPMSLNSFSDCLTSFLIRGVHFAV
jgi:hypothetical protein